MNFQKFSEYLLKFENLSSRTEMTELLAELVEKLDKSEIGQSMYLLMGRIAPKYAPLEFNFSSKLLVKTLEGFSTNSVFVDPDQIDVAALAKELGDSGLVTERVLEDKKIKGEGLGIIEVFDELVLIAQVEGSGSQGTKIEKIQNLYDSCRKGIERFSPAPPSIMVPTSLVCFVGGFCPGSQDHVSNLW